MKIFSIGSPEDYLGHIMAVLSLIDRKGLREQLVKFAKETNDAKVTLEALKGKSDGSKEKSSKKDHSDNEKSDEIERKQTIEILRNAKEQYHEVIATTYEVVRNLLAGEPLTQWDRIVCEMHESDSWAGPDGKENDGARPKGWLAFCDCLELHKLTVFAPDAAERQRYYIQQGIRKPLKASVRQFISRMQQLNGYLEYLPTLKDSSRAVATTKKGNLPFEPADLASIILAALPLSWQNQYNLTHATVPESPRVLMPVLENIERVINERYNGDKQKSKDKAVAAGPNKGKPNKGSSKGGSSNAAPKKARTEKFCQRCKTHGGSYRLITRMSAVAMTKMVSPPDSLGVNRPINISPSKRGARKGWRI
jgi:hypothetical protein